VLSLSDGFECPQCHTRLEVGTGSRYLAVWVGLAAGWLVWHLTQGSSGVLGEILPELYAILAFGFVSPLVLVFLAALQPAPAAPAIPAPAVGHAGGHH
jgi:hypothetical protein